MEVLVLQQLLHDGLSIDAIALREGKSPSTISYWLRKHGLMANGAARYGPKPDLCRDLLESLVNEGLSAPAIAGRLGCSASLVRSRLKRHGLVTIGAANRIAARTAVAQGDRQVDLVCATHGPGPHVLEGRGSYRCMRCRAAQVSAHRRRIKQRLLAEAGGACSLCGYARCVAALHFHHLDPATKSFHLSRNGVARSLERARAEAAKCVVLCANCHAEVESGQASVQRPRS